MLPVQIILQLYTDEASRRSLGRDNISLSGCSTALEVFNRYDHVNRSVSGWLKGWAPLKPGNANIIFEAKTVTSTSAWPGLVGLDDVYVIHRPCPGYPNCGTDTFRCAKTSVCIPTYMQCDGGNDCVDGSDEENCLCKPDYQIKLINGDGSYGSVAIFVQGLWRPVYCFSGERLCPPYNSPNHTFSKKCISHRYFCDGIPDCPGGTDELNCANCSGFEFECTNHKCIPVSKQCDGTPQCGDKSDEYGCVIVANNMSHIYHSQLSSYLPVCYNNMNRILADMLCSLSGQGTSTHYGSYTYVRGTVLTHQSNSATSLVPGYAVSIELCNSASIKCASLVPSSIKGKRIYYMYKVQLLDVHWTVNIAIVDGLGKFAISIGGECSTTIFDDSRLPKILHGRNAELGQLPWQIALYENGEHVCGGSIIHPNWVLTAAHCVDDIEEYSVRVGAVEVGSSSAQGNQGHLHAVSRTYRHPYYNDDYDNDIGLLYFSQPIAFNEYTRPICIASRITVEYVRNAGHKEECYLSGWGYTHLYVNRVSWVGGLQFQRVYLYNKDKCDQIYDNLYNAPPQNTTVCVDNQNFGSADCSGDSGGPLICRNKYGRFEVLGVISSGYESCFKDGYPHISQLAYPYADWITQITGKDFSDLTMENH
ncbi:hypothetical protein CHS0354_026915 [Potamilus streckersoni]|uniref:Peptidase S1 domain-containing protein n=1 Tax=Potamilus streckersoni TaxID=2493646 RepID=A0AAE0W0D7_9BIVA|nr:hypothetical protein CHS0354_026915 [Potamilus streckersoni]